MNVTRFMTNLNAPIAQRKEPVPTTWTGLRHAGPVSSRLMLVHEPPWRYRGAGGKAALPAGGRTRLLIAVAMLRVPCYTPSFSCGENPAAAVPQAGWRFALTIFLKRPRRPAASMRRPRSRPGQAIATFFIKLAHRCQRGVQCIL
jgi:hypothetical protein